MAVSETARLVASLELQDKFSRPLDSASRKLGGFDSKVNSTTRATKGLGVAGVAVGTALGSVAANLVGMVARGAAGFVGAGVAALTELQSVVVETNTVIASTGGVAGQTADEIRLLAEKYEGLNATIDDKVIQNAANTLLTFTGVGEKAFDPALEAALNMNQLLGGGPEGLQGIVTILGKALNNPIQGISALTRKGVVFTDQQKDQIKTLQESGNLFGAQQVILEELGTEYGGQFAAAGETAEGKMAKLRDTIEDLQKAFVGPLMPAIGRVRDKLIDLMASPKILDGAKRLGEAVAGLFTDENLDKGVGLIERGIAILSGADVSGIGAGLGGIVGKIAGLPWKAIGDAAKLLGTGSKALLDAFLGLPSWVQTAVLTGWGLNKLTGGALTGIIGQLASGLVKGILGINAGVVNVNGAVVNGPGGGVPAGGGGGGGGGVLGKIGGLAAIAGGVTLAGTALALLVEHTVKGNEMGATLNDQIDETPRETGAEIDASIDKLEQAQTVANNSLIDTIVSNGTGLNRRIDSEIAELKQTKANTSRAAAAARDAIPWAQRVRQEVGNLGTQERTHFSQSQAKLGTMISKTGDVVTAARGTSAMVANQSGVLRGHTGILGAIRDKSWSVNNYITIPVSVGINGSVLQRQIQRQAILSGNASDNMVVPI